MRLYLTACYRRQGGMGRTKPRPRLARPPARRFLGLSDPRSKLERRNMVKLSVSKLARIADPQAKLCKAVLINNTLRQLQSEPAEYCQQTELEQEQEEAVLCSHGCGQEEDRQRLLLGHTAKEESCDTLALCDDIISEFLGVADCADSREALARSHNSDHSDNKENLLTDGPGGGGGEESEESELQFGGSPVSPYSYSSFLSEVYKVTINKIKHKVQL